MHCTARLGQTQTQEDCITHELKSGQDYSVINAAQTQSACTSKQTRFYCIVRSVPTSERQACRLCLCRVILDLSLQVALHPFSEQTEQRVRSTSPVSPRPGQDIVRLTGLLTRPPSMPGVCRWVRELTFIQGSCMESYRELTFLSSRHTPEFRNLCSPHPSMFPTIKETMKLLSAV